MQKLEWKEARCGESARLPDGRVVMVLDEAVAKGMFCIYESTASKLEELMSLGANALAYQDSEIELEDAGIYYLLSSVLRPETEEDLF